MTLSELIQTLVDQAIELNPGWTLDDEMEIDPEVLLAHQPSWPFEYQIGTVAFLDCKQNQLDDLAEALAELGPDEEEDRAGIKDAMADVEAHGPEPVLFIGEGGGQQYLREGGSTALGWR